MAIRVIREGKIYQPGSDKPVKDRMTVIDSCPKTDVTESPYVQKGTRPELPTTGMTAADFTVWMTGKNMQAIASRLDINRKSISKYMTDGVPLSITLALWALDNG